VTLIALTLAWLSGVVPVAVWGAPWWVGSACVVVSGPALLLAGPLRTRYALLGVCAIAALLGGWRVHSGLTTHEPAWLGAIGEDAALSGTVVSEPDRGLTTTGYTVSVNSLGSSGSSPSSGGRVLVYLNQYTELLPGDHLVVRGELTAPPRFDTFDFRAYLARRGIWATMYHPQVVERREGDASPKRLLTNIRLRLDRSLQRSLPEPEASLASGIAFGRDDGLSNDAKNMYNQSGLRHLVAVSGSNVTLVAALTLWLWIPLVGRKSAWIPAAVSIAVYLAAAGLSPSVLRAGIMAAIFLVGTAIGRPQGGLPALGGAVILMMMLSPGTAKDAGFQLSAASTAGIICFAPWLSRWLLALTARSRWTAVPAWTCQAAALTLSAAVATAPIMWVTFGRLSLISPVSNVVVEPVFVLAFWASVIAAVLGLFSDGLGHAAGVVAFFPLAFIGAAASFFAGLPGASVKTQGSSATVALGASGVLLAIGLLAYRYPAAAPEEGRETATRRSRTARFLWTAAAGATALAAVPVSILPARSPGELRVDFLDIGQGDAALITAPDGEQFLIDGGPSGIELVRELGQVMPHWDRTIEAVALTHPQEDHMAGLPELDRRFHIRRSYGTAFPNTTETFGYYQAAFSRPRPLVAGDSFEFGGLRFDILWPPLGLDVQNLNDTSLVFRVTYRDVSLLFTGDSEAPVHQALMAADDLRADVLKVPHHGSKTTDTEFFAAVSPSVAVISVGANNLFGHPHPDTLAALDGTRLFRTDEDGRVTIRSDGRTIRVSSEH
jgi:competence protein ComEC